MSKASEGQARSLIASFAVDTPWGEIETDLQSFIELPPKERGARFATFLRNCCRVSVGEPKVVAVSRNRFNPKKFIGDGWFIESDETDVRSITLTELDFNKVELRTMLLDGETYVKGEEKLKRLKALGLVRLDAHIFLTLWENKALIPESWKEKVNGKTSYISFDGTVLRYSGGDRCVLCLYWCDGRWFWLVRGLNFRSGVVDLSAVLAS